MTNVDLNYAQPTPVAPPNMVFTSIRMILALLIIIVLIYIVVYILKKYSYPTGVGRSDLIKIISFSYLRSKEMLYLIQVGDKLFLLGVTPSNITLIAEFSEDHFNIGLKEKLENIDNRKIKTVADELRKTFGRRR